MDDVQWIEVKSTNNQGHTVTLRFVDDERGNELADYLKGMERREELAKVVVTKPGQSGSRRRSTAASASTSDGT